MAYVSGIDIGSVSAKAVIMDEAGQVVAYSIRPTGTGGKKTADAVMGGALEKAGLTLADISFTIATGYGRLLVSFASLELTEITCHARGAHRLLPQVRTVIDIGGQDSKIICLNERGSVINFALNDKCAAGTGRFLEVMARALDVDLDKMGELSLMPCRDLTVSSICTVFAESEVVSLVASGEEPADILAAVHRSIARRILGMTASQGLKEKVAMSGGVAKNIGVIRAIESELGTKLIVPPEAQIVGALGAAVIALEKAGITPREG